MNLLFMIGIVVALSLTNCNVESQENPTTLGDVPNEEISVDLQQTLERIDKMTKEQKIKVLTEITQSANLFSLKFYKNFVSSRLGNFVLPVFAIFQCMGLMALVSTGDTKLQIHEVLEFPENKSLIFAGFGEINRRIKEDRSKTFYLINFLFITHQQSYQPFTSDFKNISETIYSTIASSEPQLSNGTIDMSCNMGFMCCIRGREILNPLIFTHADDYMKTAYRGYVSVMGKYRQLPEIEATLLEIPCQRCVRTNVSDEPNVKFTRMFIILPNRVNNFFDWEKNIERLNIRKLSIGDLHDVNITVPLKYEATSDDNIKTLTRMGLTKMFSQNPEIFPTTPQIKVEEFCHAGDLNIAKHVDSITDPGLIDKNIPKVILNRSFITIVTTTDENPLILQMGRFTYV